MLDVRPYLDVVEIGLIDYRRNAQATAVPSHMELRMELVDILSQRIDSLRIGITTHKGNAGDVGTILVDELIDGICVQGKPDILPKVMTVTARTMTRTIGYVDSQCRLVGYLLEHNACIDVP